MDWGHRPPPVWLGHRNGPRVDFEDRTVELGFEATNLLTCWVILRRRKHGVFYSPDRFGTVKSERISNNTVHAALKERYKPRSGETWVLKFSYFQFLTFAGQTPYVRRRAGTSRRSGTLSNQRKSVGGLKDAFERKVLAKIRR